MTDHALVILVIQSPRGYSNERLERKHDESHEQFAERVTRRLMQLQAQPGRM